ncbi:MAG: hypothetical protein ACE5HD_01480 [Acidobacteriota bacterium]
MQKIAGTALYSLALVGGVCLASGRSHALVAGQESKNALVVEKSVITRDDGADGPGTVILEVDHRETGDPPDTVRIRAVLNGPLRGEGAEDLYALSAGIRFSSERLSFVPGSLRKGELLEQDGRSSLITAGTAPGPKTLLTIGASRIGAVPGIKAPSGRMVLFSLALKVRSAGDIPLSWERASFIDSKVHPVHAARFVDGTLHVEGHPLASSIKEN